jgi:hypothetical protein
VVPSDASDPSAIKRFFQEQTVGLGFGVRTCSIFFAASPQNTPGGAVNPVGWARAMKIAFSREYGKPHPNNSQSL